MKFRELLENTDLTMEIYKFLKKKFNKTFHYYDSDFNETDKLKFNYKGNDLIIYINDKDFNKNVFDYEWV